MFNNQWLKTKWRYLFLATILSLVASCTTGNNTDISPSNNGNNTNNTNNNSNSNRLDIIKQRGMLICGVNGQVPGFSFINDQGEYSGLDVDLCRAIAAALFDDPTKVEFRNLTTQNRFTAVQSGEVDVLSRNTTWTISRDTTVNMDFAPVVFYDGQGIMTTKASNIKTLESLKGKDICVLAGTTTAQNLADKMREKAIDYKPIQSSEADSLYAAYEQGRCDAVTADRSQLTARRTNLSQPDDHVVLDLVLSKEPLSMGLLQGEDSLFEVVKWVTYSLIQAEEFGITSNNLESYKTTEDPRIKRFLGIEGELGKNLGLSNDFALRVINHVGNYGEIYERNIGKPLGLDRGLNKLWVDGGLLYSPPFR